MSNTGHRQKVCDYILNRISQVSNNSIRELAASYLKSGNLLDGGLVVLAVRSASRNRKDSLSGSMIMRELGKVLDREEYRNRLDGYITLRRLVMNEWHEKSYLNTVENCLFGTGSPRKLFQKLSRTTNRLKSNLFHPPDELLLRRKAASGDGLEELGRSIRNGNRPDSPQASRRQAALLRKLDDLIVLHHCYREQNTSTTTRLEDSTS